MVIINWDEYKDYKQYCKQEDKLKMVIGFIKSYYNIISTADMFEILFEDELGKMLLNKREIIDAVGLETFMFQA